MRELLIVGGIIGAIWAALQVAVPRLINTFISNPDDYGNELEEKERLKKAWIWISIGMLVVIAALVIIGGAAELLG